MAKRERSRDGILGRTIAGVWEAPANVAARAGRRQELEALVQDFVTSMNRLGGIRETDFR